jgi:hypothetical protein
VPWARKALPCEWARWSQDIVLKAPHAHHTHGKRQPYVVVRYTDFGAPERACMGGLHAGQRTSAPPAAHPAARIARHDPVIAPKPQNPKTLKP